jgi:hypothetical protein
MKVSGETLFYAFCAFVVWTLGLVVVCYNRGQWKGACVELCRPAHFDSDQSVNGGCLCIGSDKVLRIKPDPRYGKD